jgi:phage protein U
VIVGLYGKIVFGIAAGQGFLIEELKESSRAKFVEHNILNSKPITEFVGLENDNVSLSMNFIVGYTTPPIVAIPLLQGLLRRPKAYPLLVGERVIGSLSSQFILTEITCTYKYVNGDGTLMAADIDVSLKEYKPITK